MLGARLDMGIPLDLALFAAWLQDTLSQARPVAATLLAGVLDPGKMGLTERVATRLLKAPVGDSCDWDAIEAWARRPTPLLGRDAGTH